MINGVCEDIGQYQVNLEGGVCGEYCAGASEQINGDQIPVSQVRRLCKVAQCSDGSTQKFALGAFIKEQDGPFYLINDMEYWGEVRPYVYCCPENCADCSDWGQCTSCFSGYTLSNGECVKKPTCTNGQYTASDGTCQPCSNISVPNGSCLSCSSSTQCDNISCNTGYVKKGSTCVKAATCTYPLKEVTDYSGECAGCCTD